LPSPFGDYGSIDLSQIYASLDQGAQAPVPGAAPQQGAPIDPVTGQPAPPGSAPTYDPNAPFSPPPDWGIPASYEQTAQGVQDFHAGVATGLLDGTIPSPYAANAAMRGQNPGNRPPSADGGANDGSPEARLPSQAYAGTVYGSVLTPEQAAGIKYDTPEYREFLKNQGNGEGEFTTNTLSNYRQSGSYAGSPEDLNSAIMAGHEDRFRRVREVNPLLTWDQYVRNLAPSERDTVEQITGAPTTTGNTAATNPNFQAPQKPYYTQGSASPAAQPGAILDMTAPGGYVPSGGAPAQQPPAQPAPAGGPTPPMTQNASGTWDIPAGVQTGSAVVAPPPPTAAPKITQPSTTAIAPDRSFIEKNMQYEQNILAIPEAQRTPAQTASLAAAQTKLAPYR
jgi:hypothetical protein